MDGDGIARGVYVEMKIGVGRERESTIQYITCLHTSLTPIPICGYLCLFLLRHEMKLSVYVLLMYILILSQM
jgi:hypothetical protein